MKSFYVYFGLKIENFLCNWLTKTQCTKFLCFCSYRCKNQTRRTFQYQIRRTIDFHIYRVWRDKFWLKIMKIQLYWKYEIMELWALDDAEFKYYLVLNVALPVIPKVVVNFVIFRNVIFPIIQSNSAWNLFPMSQTKNEVFFIFRFFFISKES